MLAAYAKFMALLIGALCVFGFGVVCGALWFSVQPGEVDDSLRQILKEIE